MFLEAIIISSGLLAIFWLVDIQKILGYHIPIDILFTIIIPLLMVPSKLASAALAGLILTAILAFLRWFIGYKRIVGGRWVYFHNNPNQE